MMTLPFWKMFKWYLGKIDTQLSFAIYLNDNSVPVLRLLQLYPCWYLSESFPRVGILLVWPLACLHHLQLGLCMVLVDTRIHCIMARICVLRSEQKL